MSVISGFILTGSIAAGATASSKPGIITRFTEMVKTIK